MSALSEFMTFIKDYLPLEGSTANKHTKFEVDGEDSKGEKDAQTLEEHKATAVETSAPTAKGAEPKVKPEGKTDIPRELTGIMGLGDRLNHPTCSRSEQPLC